MERITLCDHNGDFIGWFDLNAATEIAAYVHKEGNGHINGKRALKTAHKKRIVINEWDNSGGDWYYYLPEEDELATVLAKGGYSEQDLAEILGKYKV